MHTAVVLNLFMMLSFLLLISFYSLLCRYHVRSGNATDNATLHLFHFSYYGFHLGQKIQKVLQFDLLQLHHHWVKAILSDPVISECGDQSCLDSISALVHNRYLLISQIQCVHVCLQLRLCRAMFGDLEEFCNTKIKK